MKPANLLSPTLEENVNGTAVTENTPTDPLKHADTLTAAPPEPKVPSTSHTKPEAFLGKYKFIRTIGKGNFAKVKLAKHVITGKEVAIKIIDKTQMTPSSLTKLFREVRIMKMLDHPNIVKLYEVIENEKTLYLVMEYANGGEVFDYLVAHGKMKEKEARAKFRQIVSAVHYCHAKHIVHRDLKAENLLLDSELNIKLADFGFANEFRSGVKLDTFCGSPPYAAPELFQGRKYDGPEVDVWSLGVILYTLVSGSLPFDGTTLRELRERVLRGKYRVPFYMSSDCENLLKKMLVLVPSKRYTLEQILKDKWINVGYENEPLEAYVNHVKDLNDPVRIEILINMGFTREEVELSLSSDRFDNITATYHLLGERGTLQIGLQENTTPPSSASQGGGGSGASASASHLLDSPTTRRPPTTKSVTPNPSQVLQTSVGGTQKPVSMSGERPMSTQMHKPQPNYSKTNPSEFSHSEATQRGRFDVTSESSEAPNRPHSTDRTDPSLLHKKHNAVTSGGRVTPTQLGLMGGAAPNIPPPPPPPPVNVAHSIPSRRGMQQVSSYANTAVASVGGVLPLTPLMSPSGNTATTGGSGTTAGGGNAGTNGTHHVGTTSEGGGTTVGGRIGLGNMPPHFYSTTGGRTMPINDMRNRPHSTGQGYGNKSKSGVSPGGTGHPKTSTLPSSKASDKVNEKCDSPKAMNRNVTERRSVHVNTHSKSHSSSSQGGEIKGEDLTPSTGGSTPDRAGVNSGGRNTPTDGGSLHVEHSLSFFRSITSKFMPKKQSSLGGGGVKSRTSDGTTKSTSGEGGGCDGNTTNDNHRGEDDADMPAIVISPVPAMEEEAHQDGQMVDSAASSPTSDAHYHRNTSNPDIANKNASSSLAMLESQEASGSQAGRSNQKQLLQPPSSPSVGGGGSSSKPRSLRFTFSMKTTSSLEAGQMMPEIEKVLRENHVVYTQKDTFLLYCQHDASSVENGTTTTTQMDTAQGSNTSATPGLQVGFEIEVCRLPLLSVNGVRFKRISGSAIMYKNIASKISSELKFPR